MRYIHYTITIIFLLGACKSEEAKNSEQPEENLSTIVSLTDQQYSNGGFQLDTIKTVALAKTLKVNGKIDVPPQNLVSVSFPLGGYLKSTNLIPGMRVRKGENIAFIEDQALIQIQQDYLVIKAKLEYSRLEFERQQLLNETKTASDKTFQLAKAEYESQQVMLKSLAQKLLLVGINPDKLNADNISRTVGLKSPINGSVSKVNVNIGKYVQPSDVLFELINPDDIHAALTVFEKDIQLLKIGQRVDVSLVNEPTISYPVEIILITSDVDETRSGTIHCHFDKIPGHLKPGMFINATIYLTKVKAQVIPEEAVVRYEGKDFVFYQKSKSEFELVPVELGVKEGVMVEVACREVDLSSKKIVVKNAFMLLSKMKNVGEE